MSSNDALTKKKILILLRNTAMHKHNMQVMRSGTGKLAVVYRPKDETKAEKYVPCSTCYGYFSDKVLWKHKRKCLFQGKKKGGSHLKEGRMLLPTLASPKLSEILAAMKIDNVSRAINSDRLILSFGEKLLLKYIENPHYIRGILRQLGRLLVHLRQSHKSSPQESYPDLSLFLVPQNYRRIVSAVREVAGFNQETNRYKAPSLALKLGQNLCKCAWIIKSEALEKGDKEREKSAEDFLNLYSINWKVDVSTNAHHSIVDAKKNKPKPLPLSEDVKCLTEYLKERMNDALTTLEKENTNKAAYKELCKSLLTLLILFNRRRSGEVSKMKITDYSVDKMTYNEELL
jgi:hypothetical protein